MSSSSKSLNPDHLLPSWRLHFEISNMLYFYSTNNYTTAGARVKGVRPWPELWDICNGCILWLPPKEDLGGKLVPGGTLSLKDAAFFNHPVLVLNVQVTGATAATVHFATMTSLSRRSLQEFHSTVRDRYLPIYPSDPHPDNNILLRLEKERSKDSMTNPSYVCLGSVFELDWTAFRCYSAIQRGDAFRQRLTKDSFDQVVARMAFSPGSWIETDKLWEVFIEKHIPGGAELQRREEKGIQGLKWKPYLAQSSITRPSGVKPTSAAGKGATKSNLALKKEMLGERMGTDYRPRGPIKVEQGILYSLIDNEWKRAGYHSHFRGKLIIRDTQQPGAPPFQKGTSIDRTSYSPITRGWTEDPPSMRDSKGRQAMLLPKRPADSQHNPKCGYLMHEGLVLLNHNDWPIKAYPGAPLTLDSSI